MIIYHSLSDKNNWLKEKACGNDLFINSTTLIE